MEIRTILCPIDFSPISARLVQLAGQACRLFRSRLVLHHNIDLATTSEGLSLQAFLDKVLADEALGKLISTGPAPLNIERKITRGTTHDSILDLARELPADLIVMGTHGRTGLKHMLIGSTTERVIAHAMCPVLTMSETGRNRILPASPNGGHQVLVPIDFSPHSLYTLENAYRLLDALPATAHILHVVQPTAWDDMRGAGHFNVPEFQQGNVREAHRQLRALVPQNLMERVKIHVRMGPVVKEIADCAASIGASLIVMGVTPGGVIEDLLFGAASYGVLRSSPCPVWIVPDARSQQIKELPIADFPYPSRP